MFLLGVLRDLWRRTSSTTMPAGLVTVGTTLVHDHADQQFLRLVRRAHPERDFAEVPVGRPGGRAAMFGRAATTLLRWSRELRRAGVVLTARDLGLLARDAVSYSAVRRVLQRRTVAAVVVSGDLVPKRFAIAAAANAEGVPVDLVLNDQDHGRGFHPARFRGLEFRVAYVFEPHDACRVASPPRSCTVVSVVARRSDVNARIAAVIIGATTGVPEALGAAASLLETGEVDEVLVRRHPRDCRPEWAAPLPGGVRLAPPETDLGDLADRILLAVCDPATTGTIAALRAGVPCFTSRHFDDRAPLVQLPRIDDRSVGLATSAREYPEVNLRPEPCDAREHVPVVAFEDALAMTLGDGARSAGTSGPRAASD